MRIRLKITVAGTFHNLVEGVKVGDVVDIDDAEAERYIKLGYAELANQGRVEHAVPKSREERAVLDTEIVGASSKAVPQPRPPKPEPKPEPKVGPKPGASVKQSRKP